MRRRDIDVTVVRGRVGEADGPAEFWWRHRHFRVLSVLSQWVQASPWWASESVLTDGDVEVWRVEARAAGEPPGVFDLAFHWDTGRWRLLSTQD